MTSNNTSRIGFMITQMVSYLLAIAVLAALYTLVHIPVTLPSVVVGLLAFGLTKIIVCKVRRVEHVKTILYKTELIAYGVIICYVLGLALYHFKPTLQLVYLDIDSSRYLNDAMQIMKERKVNGEFFSVLIVSLFLQFVSVFLPAVKLYKGMVLGQIVMQVLSACMFFTLCQKINTEKKSTLINTIATVLYVSGFQLYVMTYCTFFHWQDGTLIVMYLIYQMHGLQHSLKVDIGQVVSILLGAFGLSVCYPFFWLLIIPTMIPEILVWERTHFRGMARYNKIAIAIATVVVGAFAILFARQRINNMDGLMSNLMSEGVIYKEPFRDFLAFIPLLVLYCIMLNKNENKSQGKIVLRTSIVSIIFMVVWTVLFWKGSISSYYYYRNHCLLWLFAWLMTAHVITLLWKDNQRFFVGGYAGLYLLATIISATGLEQMIWNTKQNLFLEKPSSSGVLPLYGFNRNTLLTNTNPAVSAENMELFRYVIEEIEDTNVPMFSSYYSCMVGSWYVAMTNVESENKTCDLRYLNVYDVMREMDQEQAEYCLVLKSDKDWMRYYDEVLSKLELVYETESGFIYKKNTGAWTQTIKDFDNVSIDQIELFAYIREHLAPKNVRVIYEEGYYADNEKAYSAYVGNDVTKYIGKITPKNFRKKLHILDEDEVQCLVVFKDSKFYEKNEAYLRSQFVAYENEAGLLVGAIGETWVVEE